MSRFLITIMAVFAFGFGGLMLGCEEKKEAGPMEELGAQADEAAAGAAEAAGDAVDAAKEEADTAVE